MRDAGHRTPDAGHRTSDNGHRTAKKAKIIYPPPRGVDIIIQIYLYLKFLNISYESALKLDKHKQNVSHLLHLFTQFTCSLKEMECYSINGKQTIYIKGVLKYKKN